MTREVTESYAMENGEITFVTISSVACAILPTYEKWKILRGKT